jgi:CDP-diacylglycerol--glycerol-3-phosphate 3-phosphatidyltransferase
MATDQLDGFLARRYEVITDYGKLADPIADKALMISALVSLNLLGDLWWPGSPSSSSCGSSGSRCGG